MKLSELRENPKNIKQNFAPVDFSDAEINDLLDEMGEDE